MRIFSAFLTAAGAALLVFALAGSGNAQTTVPVPPAKPGGATSGPAPSPTVAGSPAKSYGSWLFACPGAGQTNCVLIQQLSETLSRRVVFVWIFQYDAKGQLIALFRVPTGVFVNRGLVMKIDKKQAGMRVDYQQCNASECQAIFAVNADLLKQFRESNSVTVAIALNTGQTVNLQLKMDGFSDGMAALTAKKPPAK